MKKTFLFLGLFLSCICFAQTISLNSSFGTKGMLSLSNKTAGLDLRLESAALQSDGKIVVVGSVAKSSAQPKWTDFLIARITTDGNLDNSFGSGGMVTTDIGGFADVATCIAIQPNGKIVIGGRSNDEEEQADIALARYNANGSIDGSFGKDGKLVMRLSDVSGAKSIVIQKDGKIVVGGSVHTNESDFLLLRLLADGTADKEFGKNGIATQDFDGGFDAITNLALQSDGKILASGDADTVFPLVRFNSNGKLDKTFGRNGFVTIAKNSPLDGAQSVRGISLQSDGKIVVGGMFGNPHAKNFGVARINPTGVVDVSFGKRGYVAVSFGKYNEGVTSIAVEPNGRIIAGGMVKRTDNPHNQAGVANDDYDFALARFNPDGSLDNNFGSLGKVTTSFTAARPISNDFITQLLLRQDQLLAIGMSVIYENGWGDPVKGAIASYVLKNDCAGKLKVDATSIGFQPNTVYMGYEPAAKVTMKAAVTSPTSNAKSLSYFWSAGSGLEIVGSVTGKQQAQLRATGSGNYQSTAKLTVIDNKGCSSEKDFVISIVDARCESNKVVLCQKNGNKREAVCVPKQRVAALLKQGATLGACKN